MKKCVKVLSPLFILFLITFNSFSQKTCSTVGIESVLPEDEWQWDIAEEDTLYCNTWIARIPNLCEGGNNLCFLAPPWKDPNTEDEIKIIARSGDYTSEEGWELINVNFGYYNGNYYPYFALYHKSRNLIRVFIWYNSAINQHNGLEVTLTASDTEYETYFRAVAHDQWHLVEIEPDISQDISNAVIDIKLADVILDTDEVQQKENTIIVYPNPAEKAIKVEINSSNIPNSQLNVFNVQGVLVEEIQLDNSSIINLNVDHYSKGIYILKLKTDNQTFSKKIIIN
ncbi:MAG: hypothetical protein CMO01_30020 [Thalassobius sp.]|nr:hypothetical protein [Thalassovita sp.]